MAGTGDGRASWMRDANTDSTAPPPYQSETAQFANQVTGDPRAAAVLGGNTEQVEAFSGDAKEPKEYETRETMVGDPRRAAFAGGADTTAPAAAHRVADTGVHGVGVGDPRAAWMGGGGTTVDPLEEQEDRDIKRAIAASLKDQQGGNADTADRQTGDPRASWLESDTAQGGKQNWAAKEPVSEPGDIRDPRAPDY